MKKIISSNTKDKDKKGKTYYLSVAVIDELTKISKDSGISESVLVDDILRNVLSVAIDSK